MNSFVSSVFSEEKNLIVTHSGQFHSDELMTIALLSRYVFKKPISELKIVRTRDEAVLNKANFNKEIYVLDVGRLHNPEILCFDHHQSDASLVWNDEPNLELKPKKSSCGLIFDWLYNNKILHNELNEEQISSLKLLVKKVDACDNGEATWSDALFFSNYNHGADEEVSNRQFEKALIVMEGYLDNFIHQTIRTSYEIKIVEEAIQKAKDNNHEEIIIFHEKIEASRFLVPPRTDKAMFVATCYNNNEWSIKTVCSDISNPYSRRMSMPKEWGGLENQPLKDVVGFEGMKFCHKGLFVTVMFGTEKELLEICKKIIKLNS